MFRIVRARVRYRFLRMMKVTNVPTTFAVAIRAGAIIRGV